MRKVIFAINMTLDGNCDHTKGNPDGEVHDYFTELLSGAGILAYGSKTYELMVPFWPDMARNQSGPTKELNDFARVFDALDKVVFSRSLKHVDDAHTRIVSSDPWDEIARLKQEEGKPISIGGVDIPSQLMERGLVDEYHFVVHPIIAGEGRRLMGGINLVESLHLKLVETRVFKSGCVALKYVKA